MDQERNRGKKYTVLKGIKNDIRCHISSQEKLEAHLLDYMQKHPELTPDPPSPPQGEFQKIMESLDKRGSRTVVRKQLKALYFGRRVFQLIQKPLMILMVVLVLLAASSMGAFSKRSCVFQTVKDRTGVSGAYRK
ncbi:MAG: hypothetical protein QM683_02035 [Lacrimispora sp.]